MAAGAQMWPAQAVAGQGAWQLLQPLALLILPVTENGITADQKASTILTTQVETCRH